jgi:hypothetical protein
MWETEELKPCPFCDSEAKIESFHDGFLQVFRVKCSFCLVFKDKYNERDAINAWNKRKANP